MNKAILSVMRVSNQKEIDLINKKNELVEAATGIKHFIEVDEIVGGGFLATVSIDNEVIESGVYELRMLASLEQIARGCLALEDGMRRDAHLDTVDDLLASEAAALAQAQVEDFFGITRH